MIPTSAPPSKETINDDEQNAGMPTLRNGRGYLTESRPSFLLDDDESLSDMSSAFSADVLEPSVQGARSADVLTFDDDDDDEDGDGDNDGTAGFNTVASTNAVLAHPLRHPSTSTSYHNLDLTAAVAGIKRNPGARGDSIVDALRAAVQADRAASGPSDHSLGRQGVREGGGADGAAAKHVPFILMYSSQMLAEQITLVEKDALSEIDLKELVDVRWTQTVPKVRNWVEFISQGQVKGVDVVVARFNIMVKWVVSEIVLTELAEERVQCVVKYIHTADYARRLRNYATMYQITLALQSSDCSRLAKTWAQVPMADKQTLAELEQLIQPRRNFSNLRMEMEAASLDEGCIPFIGKYCSVAKCHSRTGPRRTTLNVADECGSCTGIYTHDLIYNAQKPTFISRRSAGSEEPLVNFERYQTAAGIVKSVLRLLEASAKYEFAPVPEVISRCLWMAALPDEEITRLSRGLE